MSLVATIILLGLLLGVWKVLSIGRREPGLPPGPPTTPIFGNALQLPTSFLHLKLAEWAAQFGEIFSIKALNDTIVVISGAEAIRNILEKQGLVTGGRPPGHIVSLATEGLYLPFQNMNTNGWRQGRKLIHSSVTEEFAARYLPLHEAGSLAFLKDTLDSPHDVQTHIKKMTVSIMLNQVFGKPCLKYKDDIPEMFYAGVKAFNECFDLGSQPLIDALPFLKWVPERWASWKRRCGFAVKLRNDLWETLLCEGEQRIKEGNGNGCYLETVLEQNAGPEALSRKELRYFGGVLLDTGSETSASFLQTLLLAFLNNPECQEKARKELDEYVPADRLPVLNDFDNLPYLQAFVKEVHRYYPLFPLGVPHYTYEDITYKGYRIPKGTTIFMNTWYLHRDPNLYDNPEAFNPERYLKSEFGTRPGADTTNFRSNFAFGAGRRICPGEPMAARVIALSTMRWLWAFKFSKDSSGTGNFGMNAFDKGLELAPLPFTCNVVPREGREDLVRRLFAESAGIGND